MSGNKVSPKTIVLIAVAGIVFIIAMLYVISNSLRSRAALGPDGATIFMTPLPLNSPPGVINGTQEFMVHISPVTAGNLIGGFSTIFTATGPIKFVSIGLTNNTGFSDRVGYALTDTMARIARVVHVNCTKIAGVCSVDPTDPIPNENPQPFVDLSLVVASTGNGPATISIKGAVPAGGVIDKNTITEVVGSLPNGKTTYQLEDTTWNFTAGTGGPVATATSIPQATATSIPQATATSIPQATATSIPQATATSIPQATATSIPGGGGGTGVTLNLKLRFQGIMTKPAIASADTVKVSLKHPTLLTAPLTTTGSFTPDANGIYSGTVNFTVPPGSGYTLFVKGPRHLQKKICVAAPIETALGSYRCSQGQITISAGTNTFDLSKIILLVGDIPQQDGVIDSYDTSFIRQSFGSTDPAKLAIGDLNHDGIIDTQDMSLVIQSLNIKYDEE